MKTSTPTIDDPDATQAAVQQLAAIAHEGRLTMFRQLIQAGPEGLAAGVLAANLGGNPPTASAQLLVLSNAGLVTSARQGRHIIYSANYTTMSALLTFLPRDCCGGRCGSLLGAFAQ